MKYSLKTLPDKCFILKDHSDIVSYSYNDVQPVQGTRATRGRRLYTKRDSLWSYVGKITTRIHLKRKDFSGQGNILL